MSEMILFGAFEQMIQNMQRMDFFQYLFPFLLTLAIVYGVLRWALKEQLPKSASALISIVIGFLVMLYGSWNTQIVSFLANISGYWLMVGSGLLFIVVMLGLVGIKAEEHILKEDKAKWILIAVIVFIGALIFFGAGGESVVKIPSVATGSDFWTIIFFIVIIAVVFLFLSQEGETKTKTETPRPG